jgi:hypothetical protein
MKRAFELISSLVAVGAMAFLIALIVRYDMGTITATTRLGALSAAALAFATIAGGALFNGVNRDCAARGRGAPRSARRRQPPSLRRRRGASRTQRWPPRGECCSPPVVIPKTRLDSFSPSRHGAATDRCERLGATCSAHAASASSRLGFSTLDAEWQGRRRQSPAPPRASKPGRLTPSGDDPSRKRRPV